MQHPHRFLLSCFAFLLSMFSAFAQPANDACSTASEVVIPNGGFGMGLFTSTQYDISAATLQAGETFAPSLTVAGLTKKSVWYKFSLPTTRAVRVSLAQPGSGIQAGNVGFAVYRSSSCVPGNADISTKLSPIETFGSTYHPCVGEGDYLIQVSANNSANGPIFLTVNITDTTGAAYDKPTTAYKFGKLPYRINAIDFDVECQSIDAADEICQVGNMFQDYTKSTWHTFRTPDYMDYLAILLAQNGANYNGPNWRVGFRLFEGDATTTPIASLIPIGGCDSMVTNGYWPDRKLYKCGELKTNTTYTIQLFYHKDFVKNIRLAVAYDGDAPTKGPQPVVSLPSPTNTLGTLNANASGAWNYFGDRLACNSRNTENVCPKSIPAPAGLLFGGLRYNLSSFFTFNLATASTLEFYANTNNGCGGSGLLIRIFKQSLTANCADLDTTNLLHTFLYNRRIACFEPGTYVVQVMGVDTLAPKTDIYYGHLGTGNGSLCIYKHLSRDFYLNIWAKTEHGTNLFGLNTPGKYEQVNNMQPLIPRTAYPLRRDTFGCANTVLPADRLCGSDTTKAVFREFVTQDSGVVNFSTWIGGGMYYKLYKGDANALAQAQNVNSFPDRITGLLPNSSCMYPNGCERFRNACVVPGTFTLVTFGGDARLGWETGQTIRITKPTTRHFTPVTAQNMGSLWDSATAYNTLQFYSDVDTFTCNDNRDTIGGFIPCTVNGFPATKQIYRQFYLSEPAIVNITNSWWNGCTYTNGGYMTVFSGRATDGLAGLTPLDNPWRCFTSASTPNACLPMQAGWYTVVSYATGPSYTNPLQGMPEGQGDNYTGFIDQFAITLTKACPGPAFNRPYKASVDPVTNTPYLVEYASGNGAGTAGYPALGKTYTLAKENFNCTTDTPFVNMKLAGCDNNVNKVAFYVFKTTQRAYVQVNTGGLWTKVYPFDVRTADSSRMLTDQPLQACLNTASQIQLCNLDPGTYTIVLFAPSNWNCNNITPSVYIDEAGLYSRFDHAAKAYDFGVITADSSWYYGKPGDVNPLDATRKPSNDFFYCTTGAQDKDPANAACYVKYNPLIYTAGPNNIVLHPNQATTMAGHEIDRRNLWYTFVVNYPGTIKIKVENKTTGKTHQYPFAVYRSDVDPALPFSAVVSGGLVDSTLAQGLVHEGNNFVGYYCQGNQSIDIYNEPCNFSPKRYYVLVENRNPYAYADVHAMNPNHQVEVSILLDSITTKPPKFDHYSQASDMGQIGTTIKRGDTDNFTCASRDLPDPIYSYTACQKTLWYKFSTTRTGNIRYRVNYKNQYFYYFDQIQLLRVKTPGDSTSNGLEYQPYTSTYYSNNGNWAVRCITPGDYYILLPGCGAVNEDVYPEVEIVEQAGDFCSAPVVTGLPGPGTRVLPVTIDCHTIGTDYGEFNPTLTCPAGAETSKYKTSWYRLDITGNDTLDVTVFIDEKTNANSSEIKYRMMTGNCGAMQEQSCVQDALTRNTYKCLAPGNSYYIQVFTPVINTSNQGVTGSIDLNISAIVHADTCLPASNCIAVANFTPQFDCTKDKLAKFTNFSTYGTSIAYQWDFGYNNQTSTAVSPSFFYPALTTDQTYTVKLITSNTACGKADTVTGTILIPARPAADLGRDTVFCTYGSTITYNATSHTGATYRWSNGTTLPTATFNSSGSHWVEVTYNNCKARDTVNVYITPLQKRALQTKALCNADEVNLSVYRGQGEIYTWSNGATTNNINVAIPGYYWADLYLNGCIVRDSFLVVSNTLRPLGNDTAVCQRNMPFVANATVNGASGYKWQNNSTQPTFTVTQPGTYWVDITLASCTFRDSITLTVDSFKLNAITARICGTETYTLPSGQVVTRSGVYSDTLRRATGCDSIITRITLTVDSLRKIDSTLTLCQGNVYVLPGGQVLNATGVYTDTLRNSRGCDSIISKINLTVTPAQTRSLSPFICAGQNYTLPSGVVVNATGAYQDTLRTSRGCDSIISTVNLTVYNLARQNKTASICQGQNYTLPSGQVVNSTGTYSDTLRYVNGCDSIVTTVVLQAYTKVLNTISPFICQGQSYTLPSGKVVTAAGTYQDTLRYTAGCDSVINTVNLAVKTFTTQTANARICAGQSFTLPSGRVVSAAGVYQDTLRYTVGCDSLINTVTLVVQNVSSFTLNPSICAGQTFTLPSGKVVNATGIYNDTLRYTSGCDSIRNVVNLTVKPLVQATLNPAICAGQTYTLPSGKVISVAGTYRDTLRYTAGGCDSLINTVNLTVRTVTQRTSNARICQGSTFTLPSGTVINAAGIYNDTLRYVAGCDSIITRVTLVVQNFTATTAAPSICAGQTYTLPSGKVISTPGIYNDTLRYSSGCDSIRTVVTLTVKALQRSVKNVGLCAGQTFTLPSGKIVSTPGTYQDTVRYVSGCDSLVSTVQIAVLTPATNASNARICQGQIFTLPWGAPATIAGIYRDTTKSRGGCDSIYTVVTLAVTPRTPKGITPSTTEICAGDSLHLVAFGGQSYQWISNGVLSPDKPNTWIYPATLTAYAVAITDAACGITDTLVARVTINPLPNINITKSNDINCLVSTAQLNATGGTRYLWTPAAGLSNATIRNPVAAPKATTWYYVQVTDAKQCTSSDSILIVADTSGGGQGYHVPSAFTPNGDGLNDCFGIKSWGHVTNLRFLVFDRYGYIVFETNDASKCWDGRVKGQEQESAAFVYKITGITICGPVERKGTVVLIR